MTENKNGQGNDTLPAVGLTDDCYHIYRSQQQKTLTAAKYLFNKCGFNLIPTKTIAGKWKSPRLKQWETYIQHKASWREVSWAWSEKYYPSGIAIVCGSTSGNLEVLDFDNEQFYFDWLDVVLGNRELKSILDTLPIIKTPSNGRHIFYRLNHPDTTTQLAWDEHNKIAIETRSHGAYVLAIGSPPCAHQLNKTYQRVAGCLAKTPLIDDATRNKFFEIAIALNRGCRVGAKPTIAGKGKQQQQPNIVDGIDFAAMANELKPIRPGDRYSEDPSIDWADLLCPHGWQVAYEQHGKTYWLRPGKSLNESPSATTGFSYDDGMDKFYSFSSNTPLPLVAGRGYTKFQLLIELNFNGDASLASQSLPLKYNNLNWDAESFDDDCTS
jgi:putative DNA primase/helicase